VLFGEEGGPRRLVTPLVVLALGVGALAMSLIDLGAAIHGPTALGCDEWLTSPGQARWVSLTGCRLDLAQAARRSWRGWWFSTDGGGRTPRTLELFLPVSASDEREEPPRAVVASTDAELLTVVDQLAKVPPSEVDAFIESHRATLEEKLAPPRLTGYVEPIASLASRTALKTLGVECVVLEQGRQPPLANAIFGVLVGIAMALWALLPFVRRFREPGD
jgi:hypothetical protein